MSVQYRQCFHALNAHKTGQQSSCVLDDSVRKFQFLQLVEAIARAQRGAI